jgi:hypothetical protein
VQQHILQMGVLNDYVRHLPTLKDSPKAVLMTKKGNVPFGKADLAAIVLSSVPTEWQNQYNLNHTLVPELMSTLLSDLEATKHVMVEKQNKKLKVKGKTATAWPEAKGNPKCKASGGPTGQVPKKGRSEKFSSVAKPTAVPTKPTTPWTAITMTAMVSPLRQHWVSPLSPRSPTRSLGATRAWLLCITCSRLMQRAKRKPVSLRGARSMIMTPVTVPTVNRKLGMATWDLV